MPMSIFESAIMRKLSLFMFLLSVWISVKNTSHSNHFSFSLFSSESSWILQDIQLDSEALEDGEAPTRSLEYDIYREIFPEAEKIIRAKVHQLFNVKVAVPPVLLRLAFHDCFIEVVILSFSLLGFLRWVSHFFGESLIWVLLLISFACSSVSLFPPIASLKGFDVIDIIKSKLEEVCPGVVSCADIFVLAAREAVPSAINDLPSPNADLSETFASFSARGFDEREIFSLFGAHSIRVIRCKFFQNRLYYFVGTDEPDPTLDSEFLKRMRSKCPMNHSSTSPAASPSFDGSPSTTAQSLSFYNSLSSKAAASPSFEKLFFFTEGSRNGDDLRGNWSILWHSVLW
ncbi:hypothetical protein CRYUN_Cryun31cG0089000 [Craigia yunnanensis]